jgi:hypothetical protein
MLEAETSATAVELKRGEAQVKQDTMNKFSLTRRVEPLQPSSLALAIFIASGSASIPSNCPPGELCSKIAAACPPPPRVQSI